MTGAAPAARTPCDMLPDLERAALAFLAEKLPPRAAQTPFIQGMARTAALLTVLCAEQEEQDARDLAEAFRLMT